MSERASWLSILSLNSKTQVWLVVFLLGLQAKVFAEETQDLKQLDRLASKYQVVKNRLINSDLSQRKVLSSLFEINTRMKKMSDQRRDLTDRMLNVNGNVKDLARQTAEIEASIERQKSQLSKKLRMIYRFNGQGVLRMLFSSQNAHDLDRNLRFLKIFSEEDLKQIRYYQLTKRQLGKKKTDLKDEVRRLVELQQKLRQKEKALEKEQIAKASLLNELKKQRTDYLKKISGIRKKTEQLTTMVNEPGLLDLLQGSFFEKKGQLQPPIVAPLVTDYGLYQDPEYRFRLSHKGHFYAAPVGQRVIGIFRGKVAFAGVLPGYGKTVILDHGDHYYTVYAHNSDLKVKMGDEVESGQEIALVGMSREHKQSGLYFEVRHFSDAIDPKGWIAGDVTVEKSKQL